LAERRNAITPAVVLLLLCLLWALPSLRSDLLPGSAPAAGSSSLAMQSIPLALFAIIATIAALARKARWSRGKMLGATVLAGLGLFVVPAVLIEIAMGEIDDSTRVALFSLAPVFAIVFEPYVESASSAPQRSALAASLVAVVGTMLVFPLDLPQSSAAVLAFCGLVVAVASVAAANCIAVRIACDQNAQSLLTFASIAAGSAAIWLALLSAVFQHHVWPALIPDPWTALDLLTLTLLFWLMRRMTAARMTTRFLIAPLVANLIGLAFLRPGVQWRDWLGLLLIALGSGWLLFAPKDEPEQTASPLGIT
jgi:drug/metabolite transporter (DMT)-like permease